MTVGGPVADIAACAKSLRAATDRPFLHQALSRTMSASPQLETERWNARLSLSFARRGPRTSLTRNEHHGPLLVQKALYPEGEAVCQAVILHPPGGIAGGDHLAIDIEAAPKAFAQLTTPGATKWYKASGRTASQSVRIDIHEGAIVEWFPLESIVFDGAFASSSLVVDAHSGSAAAGWDITAFGRTAAGERFAHGRYRQSIELRREGRLLWAETSAIDGDDPLFQSPIGFDSHTVSGLLWTTLPHEVDDATIERARAVDAATGSLLHGVTSLPDGIVIARCLAGSTEHARAWLAQVWSSLRPVYASRTAVAPRLWMT